MLTLSQLEQHLSKAAWILKGPVDAADFKVYIFPLLFSSESPIPIFWQFIWFLPMICILALEKSGINAKNI